MDDDTLYLDSVTVRYGPVTALDDVSAVFRPGVVYGLLGDNGAGKSTLIHTSVGVVKPASGRVVRPRGRIGWCAQKLMIDWFVDVRTNVWLGARLAGLAGKAAWERADKALEQVSLQGPKLTNTPEALSGGEQQRLMIARALAMDADVLFLDEPTVGLDTTSVQRIRDQIFAARNRGAIVVVSSHEFEAVESVLDEIVYLVRGTIAYTGNRQGFMDEFVRDDCIDISLARAVTAEEAAVLSKLGELSADGRALTVTVARGTGVTSVLHQVEDFVGVLEVSRRARTLRQAVEGATRKDNHE